MINLFSNTYLSRKPIEEAMREFSKNFSKDQMVLDIGCGNKPYKSFFSCNYIGLDFFEECKPDICAPAWNLPFPDNSFDGIIMNQSLEHIKKTNETILEVKRVLKNDGLGIITAPQTMKDHSVPTPSKQEELCNFDKEKIKIWRNDYYRFTKYGLMYIFKDFQIVSIEESNGFLITLFQLLNYLIWSLMGSFGIRIIFYPLFFINNVLAIITENACLLFLKFPIPFLKKLDRLSIYNSLPLNNILIIKK